MWVRSANFGYTGSAYGILERMKGGTPAAGFTIVETLIVLAVSGFLFAAIAASISGRASSAEFTQSIQNVQSQVRQAISEVSTGYYPNSGNFSCQRNGIGLKFSNVSREQGSNQDCIFLGKVLQFGVGADPELFYTYPVAGLRSNPAGDLNTNFNQSSPQLIASGTRYTSVPDESVANVLQYGLSVVSHTTGGTGMYYNGNSASDTQIGAVGFISNLGDLSDSGDHSQHVNLMAVSGTSLGITKDDGVAAINANLADSVSSVSASDVEICFVSGGTNQSGLMTIGGNGRQLSVDMKIFSSRTCS